MKLRVPHPRGNSTRVFVCGVFLLLLLTGASFAHASDTRGTIDSAHKFAWGSVAGYVNFAPTNGGLTITDSGVSGYAWSANTGWINFDTAQSGVTNDGEGTLGGFAWDEGAGWVNFTGVTIDSSGQFHGTATGGTVNGASYVITFDCTNCDVRTDWRPASSRPSSSGGGCAAGFVWNPATISCVPTASYEPVVTPPPPGAPSTVPTAPASGLTTGSLPSPSPGTPSGTPADSGSGANSQGFVSDPTSITSATSCAIHATTTARNPTLFSSLVNFIRSPGGASLTSVLILLLILGLFRFFGKF